MNGEIGMIGLFGRNLAAGILIAAILCLRALNRRIPARRYKLLWGIAALRLICPFSAKIFVPSAIASAAPLSQGLAPAAAARTAGESLFPALYYAVAALVFGGFLLLHLRSRRAFRDAISCGDEAVLQFTGKRIRVRVSDRIAAPLTYGFFRPTILLPKTALADREGLTLLLAHERSHIRRGDLFYKLLLVGAVSLGWLNPLAWVMLILANRDLEYACDEDVLKKYPARRAEYARMLLRSEERRNGVFTTAFSGNAVKERIERMMKFKKATVIGSVAAAALAAASLAVFVSAEAEKNTNVQWYVGGEDGELIPISEEDAIEARDGEYTMIYSVESDVSDVRVFASEEEGEVAVYTVTSDSGEESELSIESKDDIGYYVINEDGIVEVITEEEYEQRKAIAEGLTEIESEQPVCTSVTITVPEE